MRRSTHHAARKSPSHKRKAQKQHQPGLPSHPRPTITIAIGTQSRLLDAVDDQHAQAGTYAGNPIHELDVDVGAVLEGGAVGGRVDEEEEAEGELRAS